MQITIDTDNLSERDFAMLRALVGGPSVTASSTPMVTVSQDETPTKRPGRPRKAVAAVPDPETGPTVADAVKVATDLVANGKTAEVRAALTAAGVNRVSELSEDDVAPFLAALG